MTESINSNVLAHLRRGQTLTPLNALRLYGTLRLASAIYDLRKLGHDIKSESLLLPSGKRVAKYSM